MKFNKNETKEIVEKSTNLTLMEVLENGEKDGLWTFSATAPVAPNEFTVELIETHEMIIVQVHGTTIGYTIQKGGAQ